MDFLNRLPLTADEKEKLRALAANTPAALLGLIQASRDDFARFFGAERTQHLIAWLNPLLTEEERKWLAQPARAYPIQMTIFTESPTPVLPKPGFDLAKRDRLFDRLQRLQAESNPSADMRREIASLEQELEAILR